MTAVIIGAFLVGTLLAFWLASVLDWAIGAWAKSGAYKARRNWLWK